MAKDKNKAPEQQPDRQEQVFLREVDEAVREDQLKTLATRYGIWIFAAVIIGLGSLAGWIFYQNNQGEKSGLRSEEYIAAIDSVRQNNLDGAAKALEPLMDAPRHSCCRPILPWKRTIPKRRSKAMPRLLPMTACPSRSAIWR